MKNYPDRNVDQGGNGQQKRNNKEVEAFFLWGVFATK